MHLIWFSEKGMNPFSFRKSYVLSPSSSNTIQMWPWWSNQSSIRTQALQRHWGNLLQPKAFTSVFTVYFYIEVKHSQSLILIKRVYPLKHVNFWHGCLTVALNIFDDLQRHSYITSADKITLGMFTSIRMNTTQSNFRFWLFSFMNPMHYIFQFTFLFKCIFMCSKQNFGT